MGLDANARSIIEEDIDGLLEDPEETKRLWGMLLQKIGIEPSVDNMISYLLGVIHSTVEIYYRKAEKRSLNSDETSELIKIFGRRVLELRIALLGKKYEP